QVDRRPDRRHRTQVVDHVRRSVEEGALGVSTGLIYEPGRSSVVEDLVEIATAAADSGGLYCTHIRDEGAGLIDAIDEAEISRRLYTSELPDPDLVIRTSGEERVSNFLLWQSAYSELYFTDVFWPSFSRNDLLEAVESYQKRKRRYGE
ncbi:MAG TPA: di-trans,poly-cis-decaprenylcistransferase, partial [Candidatus Poseidoniales archaeon]|nr:di-trans,poly-cis-decaprenylcistransferase [Candidatus Poseidoniales archaeon]